MPVIGRAVGALVIALVTVEIALRALPGLLPANLANAVYSAYGLFPGGIYFSDEPTGVWFMHPDYETTAYYNGYFWNHRTDSLGYRNPPGSSDASVLLLGDSMVYGHGLEEEDTLAHVLRAEHGERAYSMAKHGDSLRDEYIRLRLHLDEIAPERVLIFVFANDVADLVAKGEEEVRAAPETSDYDYAEIAHRIRSHESGHSWLRRTRYRSRAYRLWRSLPRALREVEQPSWPTSKGARQLAADYYRKALGDLTRRTRARGIQLEIGLLDPHLAFLDAETEFLDGLLSAIAGELDLAYHPTTELFAGCVACFLPDDGHLSGFGNRRLAAFLVQRWSDPEAAPMDTALPGDAQ